MSFRSSHSAAQPLSARGVCSSGQGMMRTCLLFRFLIDKQVSAVLRVLPRPARRGRHAALGFGSSGTGSAVRHVLHRLYEINNVPWQHRPLSFVDVASSSAQTKHKGEKSVTKPNQFVAQMRFPDKPFRLALPTLCYPRARWARFNAGLGLLLPAPRPHARGPTLR